MEKSNASPPLTTTPPPLKSPFPIFPSFDSVFLLRSHVYEGGRQCHSSHRRSVLFPLYEWPPFKETASTDERRERIETGVGTELSRMLYAFFSHFSSAMKKERCKKWKFLLQPPPMSCFVLYEHGVFWDSRSFFLQQTLS